MSGRVLLGLVVMIMLVAVYSGCAPSLDQGGGRAAVVVQFSEGDHVVHVVEFEGQSISGMDLLRRSGLDVLEKTGFVCRIGSQGCDLAACPCLGEYWSYWYLRDGAWVYSNAGAAARRVVDGTVEAWVWGDGQQPPPEIDPQTLWDAAPEARRWGLFRGMVVHASDEDAYPAPEEQSPVPEPAYPGPDNGADPVDPPPADEVPPPAQEEAPLPEPGSTPTADELLPEPPERPDEASPTATTAPPDGDEAVALPVPFTPTVRAEATRALAVAQDEPDTAATIAVVAVRIATTVAENRAANLTATAAKDGQGTGWRVLAFAVAGLGLAAGVTYVGLLWRQRRRAL
jgi:hypothetical protein